MCVCIYIISIKNEVFKKYNNNKIKFYIHKKYIHIYKIQLYNLYLIWSKSSTADTLVIYVIWYMVYAYCYYISFKKV
jgi:hypothetical protein